MMKSLSGILKSVLTKPIGALRKNSLCLLCNHEEYMAINISEASCMKLSSLKIGKNQDAMEYERAVAAIRTAAG
jgi:hypothetical protein